MNDDVHEGKAFAGTRSRPYTVDVRKVVVRYRYYYKCKQCGHEWADVKAVEFNVWISSCCMSLAGARRLFRRAPGAWVETSRHMTPARNTAGVVFDWDGVLLDSLGASRRVYNRILMRVGMKPLTSDEFLEFQSPNWYEFYVKVGVPKALWKEVDVEWVRLYKEERPDLYSDAMGCLAALEASRFKLAIVSNGSKARVEGELDRLGLRSRFESVLCGEKREELKPSPVMIERTLDLLGLSPSGVVYVGDAPADIQAARNAGVPSVALARGPIQEGRLRKENPDYVFGGLDDVTGFLVGRP